MIKTIQSLLIVIAFFAVGANAASPDASARARQQDAVELARDGNTEPALKMLEQLRETHPGDAALLYDETVVLAWAARYEDVLLNAMLIDQNKAPAYVITAVAKSARDLREYETAIEWYGAALATQPTSIEAIRGLAMTLADNDEPHWARRTLASIPKEARDLPNVLMASAYLYQSDRAFIMAVGEYDAVLAGEPGRRDALRGKALALGESLLPRQALAVEATHPGTLTEEEIQMLESDVLALNLRDAVETPDERYSYLRVNMALNAIDERLAREPPGSALAKRLQDDRIVGLVDATRIEKAIIYYEDLIATGDDPPAYVHLAAGRAYLYTRRPKDAETALRRGEAQEPDNIGIQFELFYALAEQDRNEEAIQIVDDLAAKLPNVLRVPGSRVSVPNSQKMRAEIMTGLGRAYGDQMRDAQQRLESLVAAAPNNREARQELANIYRWRGWHDRAASEYAQVLSVEEELVDTRVAKAHNDFDLQEFQATEAELSNLRPSFPAQQSVWDLNRRWIVHNYSQLIVDAIWGESSGEAFGSDQYEVNAWWFSKPLKYNYRVYARTFDGWAEFQDGDWDRQRIAGGVEYRAGDWRVAGELNTDRWDFDDPGAAVYGAYRLSDTWTLDAELELNSYRTQLRADRVDIESHWLSFNAGYRRDEGYSAGTGLFAQHYDDNNTIFGAFARSRGRIVNSYTYKLDGYLEGRALASTKSEPVPYFNPERALEGVVGIDNVWRQFRRYDSRLTHRLGGNAGIFNQKNFGSDAIWSLEYELNWNVNEQLDLRFGWQRRRRVYDGGPEYQTFWLTGFNGRF